MKGTKTLTTIQVGDLIKVKTGQTVSNYEGESGSEDPDIAYGGDFLGEVTKLSGSLIVFIDSGKRIRNTVSGGGIDFYANPDFDYSVVTDKPDTTTTIQKWLNFGLGIYDKIFNKTSTTTGNSATGETPDPQDPKDPNEPDPNEKTALQKYGWYGLGAVVLAFIGWLVFGGKEKPPVQYAPPQPPVLPQYQPQNQYQNVRL